MKRLVSVFMVLAILFTSAVVEFPLMSVTAQAAATYNSTAAVTYAHAHWDDGNGLCAEFVSDCLKAGGVSSPWSKSCGTLINNLINGGYGTKYTLSCTSKAVSMTNNAGKLSAGDPVFYYCNDCKVYPHVVICTGSSGGYAIASGHNAAMNDNKIWNYFTSGTHVGHTMTMYSIHMNEGTDQSAPFEYTELADGTLKLDKCNDNTITNAVIPETVNGKKVSVIGQYAFFGFTNLKSVTIPSSVTSIGQSAFSNCTSLTSMKIPNGVARIGNSAFENCTSLTSVTIPSSVTRIDSYVFLDCTSLTAITVDASNKNYCSVDGVLFNKDKTELIQYPVGKTTKSYTIPNNVTSIGSYAFRDCTILTSVTIPNSVISIGYNGFHGCTYIKDVYYTGSQAQWNAISTNSGNDALKNATIHYNYGQSDPTPDKIANLKAAPTNSSVKLTWDKYAAASYYRVWVKQDGAWKLLKNTANNTTLAYTASGLKADTSYTFRVVASDANGTMLARTEITAKTNSATVANLKAAPTNSSVKLTWDKYAAASYYRVWVMQDGAWKLLKKTDNNTTLAYTASGLKADTSYTFRVVASDVNGTMLARTEITAKTNSATVANLKAAPTNSSVKLTWDKYAAASYYRVWVMQDGAWKLLKKTDNNTTLAYTASGLKADTSYTFRVVASDANGTMLARTEVTAKTNSATVANLKAAPTNSSVKLTWDKYAAASYYRVWVMQDGAWKLLKKTANNTTLAYTASGLKANTSYTFRVVASDANGTMLARTEITAKTKA